MNPVEFLLLAIIADAIIGDPKSVWDRFPHPAALMGRAIGWCDDHFNSGSAKVLKGAVAIVLLSAASYLVGLLIVSIPDYGALELVAVTILLAHRDLIQHVNSVRTGLSIDLESARKAVSMIVGRDVSQSDEIGVTRAAIESAAENFSDGFVAPAFWYLLFGLPGMLVYKMVNTADSMIGHLNERYSAFGKAAARIDDLMNWAPARITGAVFCMVGRKRGAWEIMREEAQLHRSPNAGWPEAAMAGSLGIALAGPRTYDGKLTQDVFVNGSGKRDLTSHDIKQAVGMLWRSWFAIAVTLAILASILSIA